ncbi:MAG: Sirohydrochlorin cobaltochelatase [Frankiales bacterium]|nr:Sirohydrochlorin cobaltochelatase [Frankiales bacterium]
MSNPLLIVGHGTKDREGVAQFLELVDRVRCRMSDAGRPVEGGFLELSAPPIQDAVTRLADAREIDVVPLVLVAAGHSKGDIPAALERERLRHPGLSFRYGRPLGPHPLLLADLTDRLTDQVPPELWPDTAVVLVGRGATDPDANAEVAKTARLLLEGRGIGTVETAFVSLAEPSVAQGLDRAERLGYQRVVVLPHFLFEGVLPQRIRTQSAQWAQDRAAEVTVADLIGPSANLAALVAERAEEIAVGDIRMSCDTCMYRTLMPGFEGKLGVPQTPHDHPDDPTHPHSHHHEH